MTTSKLRLLVIVYFSLVVLLRFVPHASNMAGFCALALFAGCYLNAWQGMIVGFGAVAISDMIGQWMQIPGMGFYTRETMLAVYLGTALPGVLGWLLSKMDWRFAAISGSLLSTLAFFVVTNFASWLDPLMSYPPTLAGLVQCYFAAIPFMGGTLAGTMAFSLAFFATHHWLESRAIALNCSQLAPNCSERRENKND